MCGRGVRWRIERIERSLGRQDASCVVAKLTTMVWGTVFLIFSETGIVYATQRPLQSALLSNACSDAC